MWISVVIAIVVGYLLGNLNGAVCISALLHDDVRTHGSGNAGLTNFIRNYGSSKALLVLLIDGLKAVVACVVGGLLMKAHGYYLEGVAIGGSGAMLGHIYPVFFGFRGGKGALSGLFVVYMIDWRIGLILTAVFLGTYFITHYVSLGSVLAALALVTSFALLHHDRIVVMTVGIVMGLMVIVMHRTNLVRLFRGTERKTNLFKKGNQA
ncbi:MAG: glycerol-3-phosphate acyltransferase [Oscillospiraceae bacterium]|nr:glycerol-3-phosphate acyltransferase [Oscillospiraceae bacterium]